MVTDELRSSYYERIKIWYNRRDKQSFPTDTASKDQRIADYMFSDDCVHEHFRLKYKDVEFLLDSMKNARMHYDQCDTYLACGTSPPGIQMSVSRKYPNLSKKDRESEALSLSNKTKDCAFDAVKDLSQELYQILYANPRDECLEWVKKEIENYRLSFNCDDIEVYFQWSQLMDIMDLYRRECEKLTSFILKEWDTPMTPIGEEELKWIKSLEQKSEQASTDM